MKTKIFTFLSLLSLFFFTTSCNEFSDVEENVIKNGRLLNEAISSEYHIYMVNYWDKNIIETVNEYAEDFANDASEAIDNVYSFWGAGYISDAYVSEQEKKAKAIKYIVDEFDKQYDQINDVIKTFIENKGISQTADELNSVIKKIESNDQEWFFNEDENSFESQLGTVIAHPKYGFRPEINGTVNVKSIVWRYYLNNDVNSGTNANCVYAILKVIQQWLNNKMNENITVVYCLPYEDSLNSYLVGYSNHKAFMITFLRNDEKNCRYEWQEMEYDSKYVGQNLLE